MSVTTVVSPVHREIRERCLQRNHKLQVVYQAGTDMEADVVRWCSLCGSVVVDVDADGRTAPGRVMQMRFPALLTQHRADVDAREAQERADASG